MDDEYEMTLAHGRRGALPKGPRVLAVTEDEGVETFYLPKTGEVTIGRFTGSKLVIQHETLSRMHAILRITAEELTIEDLGSENGTFVREVRVKPGKQVPVTPGDVVRIGDVILLFRMG